MTTSAPRDRRAERRAATLREILDAAWDLAATHGLTGWPLKDIADAVGMRTPSLYVYVDSKNVVYDAMFADGYRQLLDRVDATSRDGSPTEVLRRAATLSFDFGVEQPARFQLLVLRTLPGFVPSPDSYALAQRALDELSRVLAAAGVGSARSIDLWTAVITGLISQQISNDPGGDRWRKLLDHAVDLVLAGEASSS